MTNFITYLQPFFSEPPVSALEKNTILPGMPHARHRPIRIRLRIALWKILKRASGLEKVGIKWKSLDPLFLPKIIKTLDLIPTLFHQCLIKKLLNSAPNSALSTNQKKTFPVQVPTQSLSRLTIKENTFWPNTRQSGQEILANAQADARLLKKRLQVLAHTQSKELTCHQRANTLVHVYITV